MKIDFFHLVLVLALIYVMSGENNKNSADAIIYDVSGTAVGVAGDTVTTFKSYAAGTPIIINPIQARQQNTPEPPTPPPSATPTFTPPPTAVIVTVDAAGDFVATRRAMTFIQVCFTPAPGSNLHGGGRFCQEDK